jgi:hypothetical protein
MILLCFNTLILTGEKNGEKNAKTGSASNDQCCNGLLLGISFGCW